MNDFETARDGLVRDLRKYLVGPLNGPNELIHEPARDRYHLGMLFPSGAAISADEDEQEHSGVEGGPDAGSSDGIIALANVARQAAAGMTFHVPRSAEVV